MTGPISISDNIRGALWMACAAATFAVMVVMIRALSDTMSAFEILFFRNLFGTLVMVPWLMRVGASTLRTKKMPMYLLRTGLAYFAALSWYYAIIVMPVGEAVALHFTLPLFTIIAGAVMLGEPLDMRRSIATLVGFAGIMVVLRPGVEAIALPAFVVLASAAIYGVCNIMTKMLLRTESAELIAFYGNILMVPISLVPALFEWVTPGWADLPWLIGLGASNAVFHVSMNRAFKYGETSIVMPVDFVRLPFTVLIGLVFFAETPDIWVGVGAVIIFASTYYITRFEALRKKTTKITTKINETKTPAE